MFSNEILNIIGVVFKFPFTAPDTLWIGVSKESLNDDGTGMVEPDVSSGYQRYKILVNSANWNSPVNGITTNKLEIKMAMINVPSGEAKQWFVAKSETGSAIFWDDFDTPRPLADKSTLYFNPGDIKIGLKNPIKKS